MNELQIFNFNNNEVRTVLINEEPYFCLKDVCEVLELTNATVVSGRLKEEGLTKFNLGGRSGETTFINEGNLYKVIFQSRKPEAEKFQDWVTDEVLPSIRKTGGYTVPQTYADALRAYANEVEVKEKLLLENQTMKPKADFYDAVAESKTAIPMDQVAKVLAIKGIGRNNLFELLRNKEILQRNNVPHQKYIDRGYFRVVESKFTKSNGDTSISIKTLVYQKGVEYIRKQVS